MISIPVPSAYDENGRLIVDAYDDRCRHYACRPHALDMYRCISCVSYDPRGRCLHEGSQADAGAERKENRRAK